MVVDMNNMEEQRQTEQDEWQPLFPGDEQSVNGHQVELWGAGSGCAIDSLPYRSGWRGIAIARAETPSGKRTDRGAAL